MMDPESFFARYPVFTADEFAEHHRQMGSGHSATRQSVLAHHESRGRIVRLRRGLYMTVPPGSDPATISVDPYLVASRMAPDAVLAYHTALELHGYAHSVFEQYQYLTRTSSRPAKVRSFSFQPVRVPKALDHDHRMGVRVVDRLGLDVRVTTLERTCVDVLDRLDLSGGLEEVWRSLESVPYFDLDELVEYALRLGSATTVAKVGYFLEMHASRLAVQPVHLETLRRQRPKSPHYIERAATKANRMVSTWNIVVPLELAEQTWKEVG
ncbi:MAG: hypothetical protein RIB58_12200 [Phycisphaerales bacterium]|jgi:predicted transcriptional regulator of viral defense system